MTNQKIRVIYFTIVPLVGSRNGGLLCCRRTLEGLHADPGIDCRAVVASDRAHESATYAYFQSKGITGRFLSYRSTDREPGGLPNSTDLPYFTRRWPYPHDVEAWEQNHLDAELSAQIKAFSPDCVVVDYLPSAFYVPKLYSSRVPTITVTLNREADFYRDQLNLGMQYYGKPTNRAALLRLKLKERLIHWRSRAVVSIGKFDLPRGLMRPKHKLWISPSLEMAKQPWRYSASRTLFFVGNRGHYPNEKAIEWLATKFAPELFLIDPTIRIRLVGVSIDDVPEGWRLPNIDYLGIADDHQVQKMFRSEDLFIGPIENDFGAKFKIAEAISYGQPLLATEGAMSGVSFLPWVQHIHLDQPVAAARVAKKLIDDAGALQSMSQKILLDSEHYIRSSQYIWHQALKACLPK